MVLFLDLTLFALHIAIILINLFGWIVPRWRRFHLVVVGVTLFSWIVMGFFYGFGYCFLTDWHWEIKRQLGVTGLPNSFIAYLTNNVAGLDLSGTQVEYLTLGVFLPAIVISIYFNIKKSPRT